MREPPTRPEYKLLEALNALDLVVESAERSEFHGTLHMKMVLREDPEILSSCGFALIYGLGLLSFADARPRGNSGMDFAEEDDWFVGDMLEHLSYERGRLYFHADYVRGRMMKTTVEIDAEGLIRLETVNRGESAQRWVSTLQGKKALRLVHDERPDPQP